VLSIALPGGANGDDGQSGSGDGGFHIFPREGLTVVFRAAVETIEGQLLQAMVLGILIATFTMVGVDKRRM
jgi:hypothetical protein